MLAHGLPGAMLADRIAPMTVLRRDLSGRYDLLGLAALSPERYPCLLESAAEGGAAARYDILFAFPDRHLILGSDNRVRDERGRDRGCGFLDVLDARWRRHAGEAARSGEADTAALPFAGGWLLFLSYELAAQIEPRLHFPWRSQTAPMALALRCPAAIVFDRQTGLTSLVAEAPYADRLDLMAADLLAAPRDFSAPLPPMTISEDDAGRFLAGVSRVQDYLGAGDAFQVNLSRGWRAQFASAPVPATVYARLRSANPAPFAALLQWRGWALASSSPERLIRIEGDLAQTRPIAGTRPRRDGDDDALRIRELVGHAKERAEHVMLIDLERNDLGRICAPGSIYVDELMSVESYAHVHHIVSNVRGRLRAGITPAQVIRAVFPGGTITGAPKVRTMEIIAELEGGPRGAYTGALGYLNHNGDMDLNILIRTMELHGNEIRFRAGAGIVIDSIAERELAETRAKARGLLSALGASQ